MYEINGMKLDLGPSNTKLDVGLSSKFLKTYNEEFSSKRGESLKRSHTNGHFSQTKPHLFESENPKPKDSNRTKKSSFEKPNFLRKKSNFEHVLGSKKTLNTSAIMPSRSTVNRPGVLKDPIVETLTWIDEQSPTNPAKSPPRVCHRNFGATPEIIKNSNKLFNIINGNFTTKKDQKTSMNETLGGFDFRRPSDSVRVNYRQDANKNSKDTEAKASNIRNVVDFLAGNDSDAQKKVDTVNVTKDIIYSFEANSLTSNISKTVNADNIDRTLIHKKQSGSLAEKI
jgi:hypothetical protein